MAGRCAARSPASPALLLRYLAKNRRETDADAYQRAAGAAILIEGLARPFVALTSRIH